MGGEPAKEEYVTINIRISRLHKARWQERAKRFGLPLTTYVKLLVDNSELQIVSGIWEKEPNIESG